MLVRELVHQRRPTIVRLEHWLTVRARTHANHPAVEAAGRSWSYAELDRRARADARRLAALGVGRGDRVATTLPAGVELASLLHGAAYLGAALAPLDPRLPDTARAEVLARLAPRAVVDAPLEGAERAASLDHQVAPGAVAVVILTSGTTAAPRPVELTHANFTASAIASAWNLGVDPGDRWLCALPLFHVGGLSVLTRSAVYGTTAVLHERFEPERFVDELAGGGVTLTSLVPTMLRRLREAGLRIAPGLRAALLGGGPIPGDLLDWARAAALPVVPTYGLTEACSQVATASPDRALAGERGARPLPGIEVAIAAGEILVRGPVVAPGERDADGWLHTGDGGRIDGEGLLYVEGRLKETIVSGGENVAPAEVESALLEHPGVRDAAVAGEPDPGWGEIVVARVVLSAPVAEDELIDHCARLLAPAKVPKRVEVVETLPRNAAGKLLRDRLG